MAHELARDFGMQRTFDGLGSAAALEQLGDKFHRHQKAHLFGAQALGHIDADHTALRVDGRAAAHARVERAAKEDARVEAALHQAVVGAFGDGKAHVERVAEREDALAAVERFVLRTQRQGAVAGGGAVLAFGRGHTQQSQIVQHIDSQQADRRFLAFDRHQHGAVALGLQRELADDVVVGDEQAVGRDIKARAGAALRIGLAAQRADLHQLVARGQVGLLGVGRRRGQGCIYRRCRRCSGR